LRSDDTRENLETNGPDRVEIAESTGGSISYSMTFRVANGGVDVRFVTVRERGRQIGGSGYRKSILIDHEQYRA